MTGAKACAWLFLRLPARAGRSVDLGCGTGVHTPLLAMRRHARAWHPAGNVLPAREAVRTAGRGRRS